MFDISVDYVFRFLPCSWLTEISRGNVFISRRELNSGYHKLSWSNDQWTLDLTYNSAIPVGRSTVKCCFGSLLRSCCRDSCLCDLVSRYFLLLFFLPQLLLPNGVCCHLTVVIVFHVQFSFCPQYLTPSSIIHFLFLKWVYLAWSTVYRGLWAPGFCYELPESDFRRISGHHFLNMRHC